MGHLTLSRTQRIVMSYRVKIFGCMKLCLRNTSTTSKQTKPVAIVTGSSSGIGRSIAKELARNGYSITIHGRNPNSIAETADLCLAEGADESNILCFEGDLSKEKTLEQLPRETLKKFGRLDALINNAGEAFHPDKMAVFDAELFDRILRVNLRAPVLLAKHSIEALKISKGSILNISSVSVNNHRMFTYGISKAGVEQFTRCLALELAPDDVRVNCITPGAVMTSIWGRFGNLTDERAKQLEHTLTNYFHPLRRLTAEEDVANAVTFLLSNKGSFITGAIIPVCGGTQLPYDGRVLQYEEQMKSNKDKHNVNVHTE